MAEAVADTVEAGLCERLGPRARELVLRLGVNGAGDPEAPRFRNRAIGERRALRNAQGRDNTGFDRELGDYGPAPKDLDQGAEGARREVARAALVSEVEAACAGVREPPRRAVAVIDAVEAIAAANDV